MIDRIVCGIASADSCRRLLPRLEALEAAYRQVIATDGSASLEGDLDAYREQRRVKREAAVARRAAEKERFNAGVCVELAARKAGTR